jgi:glycosyltransferase involved in cell wall biosynthesis
MRHLTGMRWLPDRKRSVIPNGLPLSPPETADLEGPLREFRSRRDVCLVSIGRLSAEKGIDRLLRSMRAAVAAPGGDTLGLVIIGHGPLEAQLKALSAELGLGDRVHFAGYAPDAARLLGHFNGLVISSRTEGLPMTVLEAMRAGLPIVSTRVGGIPWMLNESGQDGACGLLVDPDSPDKLTSALLAFVGAKEEFEGRARAARERFREVFSVTGMAEAYLDCYREALEA